MQNTSSPNHEKVVNVLAKELILSNAAHLGTSSYFANI